MSESEFHWLVVISLWAIFAALMGAGRGFDASMKSLFKRLDAILERLK